MTTIRRSLQKAEPLLAASVDDFARLTQVDGNGVSQCGRHGDFAAADSGARRAADESLARPAAGVSDRAGDVPDSGLKTLGSAQPRGSGARSSLPQVAFTLEPGAGETFAVKPGESLYSDAATPIVSVAPELDGLTGIRVSAKQEKPLEFTLDKPAQILVGFFKSSSSKAMNVSPATEQWNILLPDAITTAKGLPVTVWTKPLPAGRNDLDLGKGAYVVVGFIPEDAHVTPHVNFAGRDEWCAAESGLVV